MPTNYSTAAVDDDDELRERIAGWMRLHLDEHRDARTGEVNLTSLVEAWDHECADGGVTLDELHPAWEIAVEVSDGAES